MVDRAVVLLGGGRRLLVAPVDRHAERARVDLFWPSAVRVVTPGNRHWRLQVGSKAEMILLAVLLALTVALYPLSHLGFGTVCNGCCATSTSPASSTSARPERTGTLDLTPPITGPCSRSRGNFRWSGLAKRLDRGAGRPAPGGGVSPAHHNLYPLQARLIQGEPLRVVAERVDMAGRTLRGLGQSHRSEPALLSAGELEIPDGRRSALAGRLDSVDR